MTEASAAALVASLPGGMPSPLGPGCKVVVTGCAGFIGSTLSEALLALGCRVVGVDSLTDYYDPAQKEENLAACRRHSEFTFVSQDILALDAVGLLAGSAVCFHLAAQAGVRASWGQHFTEYLSSNVEATQHLLEACLAPEVKDSLQRFVYSSSSSVYGNQAELPVTERVLPRPQSPYGVTKLAAEHLCVLYAANWKVPVVGLRYFTVYGPRQRPDMAFRKFIEAALDGRPFTVYGDGTQTRDFTYVDDAVRANLLALRTRGPCEVFNVGGGTRIPLRDALAELHELLAAEVPGLKPELRYETLAKGDVRDTYADRSHVEATVGYRPTMQFGQGLAREVQWAVARRQGLA